MSEQIAKVIRDIKTGRVVDPAMAAQGELQIVHDMHQIHKNLISLTREYPCQIIDATPMFDQMLTVQEGVNLYDDFRLMPVWDNALIGFTNNFGNVRVVQVYSIDKEDNHWGKDDWDKQPPYLWKTDNEVDWDAVRYRFVAVLWVGGMSQGKAVQTVGPVYRWDVAVYEDGSMADIRWTDLYDFGLESEASAIHQHAMLVWMQTYTLAGCSNVEIVTPVRKKPERKRLERLGVNPQKIVIKKTSKSYRYHKDDTDKVIGGVPQGFVRGHYARYGPEYDRGLLFGKYSGKFWIPARATSEVDREIDYITEGASH